MRAATPLRRLLLACCLVLLLPLTGCWDFRQVNERAFIVMLGIDKGPGGKGYHLSFQEVIGQYLPGAQSGGGGGGGGGGSARRPWVTRDADGASVPATLERLRQQTHRELDFNHLKVVVLGEAVARESTPTLDELERNMQIPRNVFMAVAHGQARPLLSASARGEDIPAIYLRHAYAGKYARTRAILAIPAWHLLTFTAREPLRDTMAGGLCIDKEGILNFCGAAVWKGKRMIGWLDATETGALNMMSRIRKSDGDIVAPGNPAPAVHVTNHTSRYWIERETTGALVLHLSLLTQGDLVNSDRPIVSTQDLSRAEARLAETQRRQVERMIRHLQRLGSDPLGFGERLRRREPDAPEVQGTEAWHAAYVRARVQVDSGVLIYNRGFIR